MKRLLPFLLAGCLANAQAIDLGIEGPVFEIIEEDFRIAMMRMVARHDWTPDIEALQQSAEHYTKRLPSYYLPRAEKTRTIWKDAGVITKEDIYLPWVDWETGSVMAPERVLAVEAGTYINPLKDMVSAGIERLFVFDATDPEQMAFARALLARQIPQLSFMVIAGDPGELSRDVDRPIYHPPATMLDRFHIKAAPALIGFGRGIHQGHIAITEIHLPSSLDVVSAAWFGLGDRGDAAATLDPSKE